MIRQLAHALLAALALLVASTAPAAVPGQIEYGGELLDPMGDPLAGPVDLDFALFDAEVGGTLLWSESLGGVALEDGRYLVVLGETVPIGLSVIEGGEVWIEVSVDGEVFPPRERIVAVPYALLARDTENVGGISNVFISQLFEHTDFDGGLPANDDPREGFDDVDGDGRANFIDPDNDGDGVSDEDELANGTDINIPSPNISQVLPNRGEASAVTRVNVTGSGFLNGVSVQVGSLTPNLLVASPTLLAFDVGPHAPGTFTLSVVLPNGESDSRNFTFETTQPVIGSVTPNPIAAGGAVTLLVGGSNFFSSLEATLDGTPLVISNLTPTSFEVNLPPQPAGTATLEITSPSGFSDSVTLTFVDAGGIAFMTRTAFRGDFGGVAGADAKCAAAASAAGRAGTFLAWVSDGATAPADRFAQTRSWSRADSAVVAGSYADLTDGMLDNTLVLDEVGAEVPTSTVWTGVGADGTATGANCGGWTSTSGTGRIGAGSRTSTWTDLGDVSCNSFRRLLCFEQ